jgi:hypothetical protein
LEVITGVFFSRDDAERSIEALRAIGVSRTKISLLTPGDVRNQFKWLPVDTAEQPGMGKALGAVVGGGGGLSTGTILMSVFLPGVGLVTAAGLLAIAVLGAAGAGIGAAAGASLENAMTDGLPEDEIFVYEDALRKGRSVVIALAEDAAVAEPIRDSLRKQGAEAIDAARHQWWIGLRDAEREHYSTAGKNFADDEKFYRLGFESALHARTRCKQFDQVSAEMAVQLEDLKRQYPDHDVEEAFTRGYQRGREHFQRLCNERAA